MNVAFSSVAGPDWDLDRLIDAAKQMGYDGLELRGLAGQMHLPTAPVLAADPDATRKRFESAGVELVCLAGDASFTDRDPFKVADEKARVREYIELAGALGAPFVRVLAGYSPRARWFGFEPRAQTLARIADALRELAPVAAEQRVTLVIENQGDFVGSADLWWVLDAVSHPAVGACYSPFNGMTIRERPTTAVPRLGRRTRLVHLCDGRFDATGRLAAFTPLGQGHVELRRCVQLLRGVGYDGYFVVHWPKLHVPKLDTAEAVLPAGLKYLRSLIAEKQAPLTAYKGDKNAPTLGPRTPDPRPKAMP